MFLLIPAFQNIFALDLFDVEDLTFTLHSLSSSKVDLINIDKCTRIFISIFCLLIYLFLFVFVSAVSYEK